MGPVKVFLSWSGDKSRHVALALREWLPAVINAVEPFVSSKDIYAGTRWQQEIADQLETTHFGLVCVTRDNQSSAWLNFEAGALAKAVDSSRVVPLAIDLKPSDVKVPLGQFQAQPASQTGIAEVLGSINAACETPLPDRMLSKAAAKWWPDLATVLEDIERRCDTDRSCAHEPSSMRSDRELLEEVLDAVRSLGRPAKVPPAADRRRAAPPAAVAELMQRQLRKTELAHAIREYNWRDYPLIRLGVGAPLDEEDLAVLRLLEHKHDVKFEVGEPGSASG